jgi:hypothetical protein
LTSIEIPNSVTAIYDYAFRDCTGLTSVEIPNSVTNIYIGAFCGCTSLISIEIPDSVIAIQHGAFAGCTSLTSIEIPGSVTLIYRRAFIGCSGLEQIIVDSENTVFDSRENCNAIINSTTYDLVIGCKNTVIPSSVTTIGNYAFDYCTGLTSIEIPNSVTSIGNYAFSGCSGLSSIEIPNSVISIGVFAFSGCSSLTSIEIPNSVTSLDYSVFSYCTGLTSVEIPNSVTSIGNYAFSGCSGLTSMTVLTQMPPTIQARTFDNCPKSIPVYVPCGSVEAYQSAAYWSEFTNYLEMHCPTEVHFTTAGNWNEPSNWQENALPTQNDIVFIDAPCQLDMDAEVADLTISTNQSLTLQPNKTLTVTGTLTNTSVAGLVIEDGAQLWHNSDNVMATVKKYIVGHDTLRRRFSVISTPMTTSVNPEDASTNLTNGDYDLYGWLVGSPDSLEWRNYKANPFMLLSDGYGYLYSHLGDVELSFPGALRCSDDRFGVSVDYVAGEDFHYNGWNLIGNPFACEAYLVDEEGNPLPYYRMNPAGRDFELVTSGAIAPMESVFFVASESGTVYFTRDAPVQEEEPLEK